MQYLLSRAGSKVDDSGNNIPIDLQNRSRWDQSLILLANDWLAQGHKAEVNGTGRFYLEALIAQQHCQSPNFESTPWHKILFYYQRLYEITGSPVTLLNLAIAQAYSGDVHKGIAIVDSVIDTPILANSHLPFAALANLHAMLGDQSAALDFANRAIERGPSEHEVMLMMSQIERHLVGYR